MPVILLALVIAVALLLFRRRRRKSVLAGLDSNRPVFQVDPPRRRVSRLRGEQL